MESLIAAYAAAWVGIVLYVARLAVLQRQLRRRIETLETFCRQPGDSLARAA